MLSHAEIIKIIPEMQAASSHISDAVEKIAAIRMKEMDPKTARTCAVMEILAALVASHPLLGHYIAMLTVQRAMRNEWKLSIDKIYPINPMNLAVANRDLCGDN